LKRSHGFAELIYFLLSHYNKYYLDFNEIQNSGKEFVVNEKLNIKWYNCLLKNILISFTDTVSAQVLPVSHYSYQLFWLRFTKIVITQISSNIVDMCNKAILPDGIFKPLNKYEALNNSKLK
jgi:hypothetical protein